MYTKINITSLNSDKNFLRLEDLFLRGRVLTKTGLKVVFLIINVSSRVLPLNG